MFSITGIQRIQTYYHMTTQQSKEKRGDCFSDLLIHLEMLYVYVYTYIFIHIDTYIHIHMYIKSTGKYITFGA